MKKIISVLAVLAVIGVVAAGAVFVSYNGDVKGGKGGSEEITVELEKGMGAYSVANVLAENGIVKNEMFFKLYAKQNPINNLQYGTFILREDMSYEEIVKELTTPKDLRETVSVTVFEGSSIVRISKIVEEAGAEVVGIGIAIEKGFQNGGATIRSKGYDLHSIAIIDSMNSNPKTVNFR